MYSILQENPYRLAEDIDIGFKTADAIAARIGISQNSDYRIRCGILFVLSSAKCRGSVYLRQSELTARAAALLGVPKEDIATQVSNLSIERKIVQKEHFGK